jgi:hypothetical protein
LEAAVEGYLARGDAEPPKLGDGVGQQRVLVWGCPARPPPAGSARALCAFVLGHLRQLSHIAELVRLAELALADRARVRVRQRDDAIGDRLALDAPLDLGATFSQRSVLSDVLCEVGVTDQVAAAVSA